MMHEIHPTLTPARQSHLYSHTLITNGLKLVWIVIVVWGDLGAFFWSLSGCRWPEVDVGLKTRPKQKTTHVLLVADPQVHHPTLLVPGSWWANPMRRVMFELNLRKSWHVTSRLRPHVVIFLGDMLSNGKAAQNLAQYQLAANHFKSIFSIDPRTTVHYVPGNNDVGLGYGPAVSNNLRLFFTDSFGPLNQKLVIANHTVIALDAPALVDEDYQRHAKMNTFEKWKPVEGGPVEFVKEIGEYGPGHIILLSHIPLSRSETANCGPLREKDGIRRGAGPGYQSMLGKQTTSFLFENLEPLVVFSGDNRDYCEYNHILPPSGGRRMAHAIREVTVKSFSMSVHIKRPGFQLLSLVDPSLVQNPKFSSFADAPCTLPDQYRIYTSFYVPCICVTILVLFIVNLRKGRPTPLRKPDEYSVPSSPRINEWNSDNPDMHPDPSQWSATWSPYSPAMPNSPRAALPPSLRTPHTVSTTHLVASLPGTPIPSSPSSRTTSLERLEEDEDDTMYPAQYATRRESHALRKRDDDEWSHIGHHDEDEDFLGVNDQESVRQHASSPKLQSQFISAPEHSRHSTRANRHGWSYVFVFKGRRRRIVVGFPSWNSLHNVLDFFGLSTKSVYGMRKRRRGLTLSVLLATVNVFWPAGVVWLIINWTML